MAKLSFNYDGQSYISDVFSGGKVVQLSFHVERTHVLYIETRLGSGLPWKTVDSRILEKQLVVNIPAGGEGQEFRLHCITKPTSAEIVTAQTAGSGGSGITPGVPLPENTVNSSSIQDGTVQKEDLDQDVQKGLDELNNISITDEDIEHWFDDDQTNDDDDSSN